MKANSRGLGAIGWLLLIDLVLTGALGLLGIILGYFWAYLVASAFVLALIGTYGFCQLGWREGNQAHFLRFIKFLVKRPVADWMLAFALGWAAGALALILSYLVNGSHWNELAPEAVGAFLAGFTATMAANVLYRSYAPIEDLEELLRRVTEDLSELLSTGGELWFVFPALSLGAYRAINDDGSFGDDSPFWNFKQRIEDCTGSSRVRVRLVTYDLPLTEKLFDCYHEQQRPTTLPGSAESGSGADQKLLAWKKVENRMRDVDGKVHTRLIRVDPAVLTNLYVVAGSVTYSIQAHGLPYYLRGRDDTLVGSKWEGKFVPAGDGLAELIAYRRDDPGLAKDTRRQLAEWTEGLCKEEHLAEIVSERAG